jgi:chemotaxis protein methyltransferase CheR
MVRIQITDEECTKFRTMLHRIAGIRLAPEKRELVSSRLTPRLLQLGMTSFDEYFRLVASGEHRTELQFVVDLLTTNETYFFRESKHIDFLSREVLPHVPPARMFRAWSAACSTGEEPYTLAMVLAAARGLTGWEIVASDISSRVLEQARNGHYPLARCQHIPPEYLKKYCLKGIDAQEGTLLVDAALRQRVRFLQVNLNATLPALGEFDIIFLRNVLIYFDHDTRRNVLERLLTALRPGGHFIIGHSETLNEVGGRLEQLAPSIYRRPARTAKAHRALAN